MTVPKPKRPRAGRRGVVRRARRRWLKSRSILLEEAGKLLLEPGDAAAAVHQLLGAAGPGRVRLGIDIEVQLVAFLAPGGARLVLGAVGHDDCNRMIIRVNFGFHGISLWPALAGFYNAAMTVWGRFITYAPPQNKSQNPRKV